MPYGEQLVSTSTGWTTTEYATDQESPEAQVQPQESESENDAFSSTSCTSSSVKSLLDVLQLSY